MVTGFEALKSRSYADLERIAARARQDLAPDIPIDGRLPVLKLLDRLPDMRRKGPDGSELMVALAVAELPKGVMAQTSYEQGELLLTLSPATYDDIEGDDGRARFTVIHEIGHLTLHVRELIELSRLPHSHAALMRGVDDHPVYFDTEWQANGFASAFLAPANGLGCLAERVGAPLLVDEVADAFGLSRKAAEVRLSNYISRRSDLAIAGRSVPRKAEPTFFRNVGSG